MVTHFKRTLGASGRHVGIIHSPDAEGYRQAVSARDYIFKYLASFFRNPPLSSSHPSTHPHQTSRCLVNSPQLDIHPKNADTIAKMPPGPVCPLAHGRQFRRFFTDHCTPTNMRGFTQDDWVLMAYCPVEDGPNGEENYPQEWVTNPRTLAGTLGWWRAEMKRRYPNALPRQQSGGKSASLGSSAVVDASGQGRRQRASTMSGDAGDIHGTKSTAGSGCPRQDPPLLDALISQLRGQAVATQNGMADTIAAHSGRRDSQEGSMEDARDQGLGEDDRLLYSFYREQRRARLWLSQRRLTSSQSLHNRDGAATLPGQLRVQLADLRNRPSTGRGGRFQETRDDGDSL